MKAYNRLLKVAKTVEPKITVNGIRKKLRSLRAPHRKEKRKVTDSLKTAKNPKEVYVPKLWYYKEFLNNQMEDQLENSYAGNSSEKSNNDNSSKEFIFFDAIEIKQQESDDEDNESVTSNLSLDSVNSLSETWEAPSASTSKKPKRETTESLFQNARNRELNEIIHYIPRTEDEFNIFGKSVAAELMKMNSMQRTIAKKLTNDVIFHRQLQYLTVDAQIATHSRTITLKFYKLQVTDSQPRDSGARLFCVAPNRDEQFFQINNNF